MPVDELHQSADFRIIPNIWNAASSLYLASRPERHRRTGTNSRIIQKLAEWINK